MSEQTNIPGVPAIETVQAQILPPGMEGAAPEKKGRGRPKKGAAAASGKASLVVPEEQVNELQVKRDEYANDLRTVQNWPLTTQEEADILTQVCTQARSNMGELEARRKKITDPLDAAKKEVKALFDPPIEYLKSIIAAGKARLEGRLQSQRDEQRNALAAVNEAGGRVDAATMAIATGSAFVKPTDGSYEVEYWHFEVTDMTQLPGTTPTGEMLWMPNAGVLANWAETNKEQAATGDKQIPGVRFYSTRRLVMRRQG